MDVDREKGEGEGVILEYEESGLEVTHFHNTCTCSNCMYTCHTCHIITHAGHITVCACCYCIHKLSCIHSCTCSLSLSLSLPSLFPRVDSELDLIQTQQQELEELLSTLEKELDQTPSLGVGGHYADMQRTKT